MLISQSLEASLAALNRVVGESRMLWAFGISFSTCPLSQWCYLTISSSAIPFSFCLQSSLALWSFPMSRLFASGGQNIEASATVNPYPPPIFGMLLHPLKASLGGWRGWIDRNEGADYDSKTNSFVLQKQITSLNLSYFFHVWKEKRWLHL